MKIISSNTDVFVLAVLVMLSGCAGSDDASAGSGTGVAPPVVSAVLTGVYLDAKVEGLGYSTATQSGKTNANGDFKYKLDETVIFTLFGQVVSLSGGHAILTPMDNNTTTVHADYPINLLRFIQTMDLDNNPANGITLSSAITEIMNVNFSQSMTAFANDADMLGFLSRNKNVSTLSVSVASAVDHFKATLSNATDNSVFKLAGKTATSVSTKGYCSNTIVANLTYTFTEDGYTTVGVQGFNVAISGSTVTCTAQASASETFTWADALADTSSVFYCGKNCNYKQLNRIDRGTDGDGREHITSVWHTPNTKKLRSVKRVTSGQMFDIVGAYAFDEVLTFD